MTPNTCQKLPNRIQISKKIPEVIPQIPGKGKLGALSPEPRREGQREGGRPGHPHSKFLATRMYILKPSTDEWLISTPHQPMLTGVNEDRAHVVREWRRELN